MEWIYIVTWLVFSGYCASPEPSMDIYGISSNMTLAVCIWHETKTTSEREFETKKEAESFIENYYEYKRYATAHCDSFKIDSILNTVW